jgi:hypothetical protein
MCARQLRAGRPSNAAPAALRCAALHARQLRRTKCVTPSPRRRSRFFCATLIRISPPPGANGSDDDDDDDPSGVRRPLAPLELGARLEKRAALHARFSHVVGRALLLAMIYVIALELFPRAMAPGGQLWSLLLVWVASYHTGELFEKFGAPKALGMLISGLILRSLPPASPNEAPLQNLVSWWSKDIRAAAMALVLLRAGLGMDISAVRVYGAALPIMATLPTLIESVIGAAFASYLFGMPYTLAWVISFMVSAVGPAIVASGCSAVKERGFAPAAPNFLMMTAVFDDTTCIIGFNCLLHALIPSGGNVGWDYAIGPMNLILGVFGGTVAALALSATALFPGGGARTWTLFAVCMCLIFVAETHELLGAGAIANLVFGLGVRALWKAGWPRRGGLLSREHAACTTGAVADDMLHNSLAGLYRVWNIVFYPLLFGLIGASLNARTADPALARLAVAYAFFTVAIRFFATLLVTQLPPLARRFTRRERVFMALAWVSKATTQAAFATVPLLELQGWVEEHPGELWKGYSGAELIQFGYDIQWCCAISIFVGTPLGTVFMNNFAPYLLARADDVAPELAADAAAGGDEEAVKGAEEGKGAEEAGCAGVAAEVAEGGASGSARGQAVAGQH